MEAYLINYINTNTSYTCAATLSNPRVEDVTVEPLGGDMNYVISEECQYAIRAYGDSREQVSAIASTVRAAMLGIADEDNKIAKATFSSLQNVTTREPEYQFVITLIVSQ